MNSQTNLMERLQTVSSLELEKRSSYNQNTHVLNRDSISQMTLVRNESSSNFTRDPRMIAQGKIRPQTAKDRAQSLKV